MPQLPRYQPQFAWLEKYINKRYPGQEATFSSTFHFPLSTLCASTSPPLLPSLWGVYGVRFRVLCTRACVRALTVHLWDPEYHYFSRFLNSSRLLSYFLERKTSTRVGHFVSASIVSPRVAPLISICRSFVFFTFLSLYISLAAVHRYRAVLSFISYILLLDARR